MARELLITGLEAAECLGISFTRFKVAIWRGQGLDPLRLPNGKEAKPVVGNWSARTSRYRARDILRMHQEYPFRTDRVPNLQWLEAVSKPGTVVPKLRTLIAAAGPALAAPKKRAKKADAAVDFLFDWLR